MGEIDHEEYEWAAIDRMGKMLHEPHPNFKTTHTYSSFASILCWTVQRIRTSPVYPDTSLNGRQPPPNDTNFPLFDAIQLDLLDRNIENFFGRLPSATDRLNTLRPKDDEGEDISALAFVIALRNAVAHGDGRKVKPVNRPNQLVGFELSLSNPCKFPKWSCETQLNRSAIAQIAGSMVDVFCNSFRKQKRITESDLEHIVENE